MTPAGNDQVIARAVCEVTKQGVQGAFSVVDEDHFI